MQYTYSPYAPMSYLLDAADAVVTQIVSRGPSHVVATYYTAAAEKNWHEHRQLGTWHT